jgi:hypothetical protein
MLFFPSALPSFALRCCAHITIICLSADLTLTFRYCAYITMIFCLSADLTLTVCCCEVLVY